MAVVKSKIGEEHRAAVAISNRAASMLTSLYGKSPQKVNAAIRSIQADLQNPGIITRVAGYDNVFVARTHGMQVVFTRKGDSTVITSVTAEG